METWSVFCDVGTDYILSASNSCFASTFCFSRSPLTIGLELHLNSKFEIKFIESTVSYICIRKTGLSHCRITSQYFTLRPTLLYLKDERELPGNIQGRIIFCFRVINVEYLTNAPSPHSPRHQFLALRGAKYFAAVYIGI